MAVVTSVEAGSSAPKATQPVRPRRRKLPPLSSLWSTVWRPLALVAALVVAWWVVTEFELVEPYILPSPAETWRTTVDNSAYLLENTWVTTYETVVGFVIAALIGEAVALVMIYSRSVERTMYPLILFAQVIPKIAIAPLFIVWLGFGTSPKILVAVLMAFFPIVISGMAGLRSVDPEILELTSTMGAGNWKTFVKVRFPASLPPTDVRAQDRGHPRGHRRGGRRIRRRQRGARLCDPASQRQHRHGHAVRGPDHHVPARHHPVRDHRDRRAVPHSLARLPSVHGLGRRRRMSTPTLRITATAGELA
ncbi:ABC transporter permease [Nocardia farcinica]|uniref:ABC transporter permease n=1 Tax=Nocardia farcinica TaxID=37329 RepID=UPI0020170588